MGNVSIHLPQRLYKYFPPGRVDILKTLEFRYTPLGAFNDPFEGRPALTGITTTENAQRIFSHVSSEEIAKAYAELAPDVREKTPYVVFQQNLSTLLSAQRPEMFRQLEILSTAFTQLMENKFDQTLGALCMSEVPNNLLMWSHYAASHTGFVLEFNAEHPYFDERRSADDTFRYIRRVLYRDVRPIGKLSELDPEDFFFIKSMQWSYEREWRIIRSFTDATKVVPATPYPIHLFALPPEAITGVIVGARTTNNFKKQILKHVEDRFMAGSCPVRYAILDSSDFVLRIGDNAI